MYKLKKFFLLLTVMIFACTSSVFATPISDTASSLENEVLNNNGLVLTVNDIVKKCSVEDYCKMLADETGAPLEQVRAKEIEKLQSFHSNNIGGELRLGD